MPKTVSLRPNLIDVLITNERLGSYQTVFNPANDLELVGAYLWNAHVCSSLYSLVGAAEIALRNAMDQALTADLGAKWWRKGALVHRGAKAAQLPFPVKVVTENFQEANKKASKEAARRAGQKGFGNPSHGDVIGCTDFSTWEFLLDREFMGPGMIWPKHLGSVFQGPWPSAQASATLAHAQKLTKTTREFRNRLFHHEPAWKRYGVKSPADAIAHLEEKVDRIESLISLIHPEKTNLLVRNGFLPAARRACSMAELRRFQRSHRPHKIGTMRKLIAAVDTSTAANECFEVTTFSGQARKFVLTPLY